MAEGSLLCALRRFIGAAAGDLVSVSLIAGGVWQKRSSLKKQKGGLVCGLNLSCFIVFDAARNSGRGETRDFCLLFPLPLTSIRQYTIHIDSI